MSSSISSTLRRALWGWANRAQFCWAACNAVEYTPGQLIGANKLSRQVRGESLMDDQFQRKIRE